MKFNYLFREYLNCSDESEAFQYFQDTLIDSITGWDYFVNWQKVLNKFKEIEIHLNTLNYLIGKEDIENEFRSLLQQTPKIIAVIPILIACRTSNFEILTDKICIASPPSKGGWGDLNNQNPGRRSNAELSTLLAMAIQTDNNRTASPKGNSSNAKPPGVTTHNTGNSGAVSGKVP